MVCFRAADAAKVRDILAVIRMTQAGLQRNGLCSPAAAEGAAVTGGSLKPGRNPFEPAWSGVVAGAGLGLILKQKGQAAEHHQGFAAIEILNMVFIVLIGFFKTVFLINRKIIFSSRSAAFTAASMSEQTSR